jgi:lysine-N-methylase
MYIYMDIIKDFSCEMCGQCCRNDWQVTMNEESYWRNSQLFMQRGSATEFAKAFIPITGKKELGEFAYIAKKASGGCWFLGRNNLCHLQSEAGHSHLDTVCQTFPRYPMNTSRGTELTLSFSCPAVIKLASRIKPLTMIRAEERPIAMNSNNDVVYVYPEQQSAYSPLRYYFEIEQHFIDLLQFRAMAIGERIQLLKETIQQIDNLQRNDTFSQKLTHVIYANYEMMDNKEIPAQFADEYIPEMLIEHFLVNFVFKKPFYLYGLQQGMVFFDKMWQTIEKIRKETLSLSQDMERTAAIIMELEFQYSHNRKALLNKEGGKERVIEESPFG